MEHIILHSDLNCFYASVEEQRRPALRGKPIAVCGDPTLRHGIILTANYPAKAHGVKVGQAIWQAQQLCPSLVALPADFSHYLRVSRQVRAIYGCYTDQVEPFGIDEAWLDVTGSVKLYGDGREIAWILRRRIEEELGITASIGVSYNKVFAKLGSDYKKPNATTVITRQNYQEVVWPLPVEDLLYVGSATRKKLRGRGIYTIGELAQTDPKVLQRWLGKWGGMLWQFANGYDRSPVAHVGEEAAIRSVGNSCTAPHDLCTDEEVRTLLYVLADSVAQRLREQGLRGQVVHLSVRDDLLSSQGKQTQLSQPTCLTGEIAEQAWKLFQSLWHGQVHPGQTVRSLGVSVSHLCPQDQPQQLDLLGSQDRREQLERLETVVDGLRRRYGHHCVQRGIVHLDGQLQQMDPMGEHIIHPLGYFQAGSRVEGAY